MDKTRRETRVTLHGFSLLIHSLQVVTKCGIKKILYDSTPTNRLKHLAIGFRDFIELSVTSINLDWEGVTNGMNHMEIKPINHILLNLFWISMPTHPKCYAAELDLYSNDDKY